MMPARRSGSPRQQCIRAISAFVDSIDSHMGVEKTKTEKKEDPADPEDRENEDPEDIEDWKMKTL